MSRDYPLIGPGGGIRLEGVTRDGEFHLIVGAFDEPGAAELIVAITKLADMASLWRASAPVRRAARKELDDAIEALHLAGRVAA